MKTPRARRWRLVAALWVAATIVIALSAAGCWDKKEIESLGFVTAAGLDRDQATGLIQVTAAVAKPFAISTNGTMNAGAVSEKPSWLVTATGRTVFEAVRNLARQSPRRLYWSHCYFIVFGEQAARQGILEFMDFLTRQGDIRPLTRMLVAEGTTAADFLNLGFEVARTPPQQGLGLVQNVEYFMSTLTSFNLCEVLGGLREEGIEPVMGRAQSIIKGEGAENPFDVTRTIIPKSPAALGGAAFKGDKLVGLLSETEARGLLWLKGRVVSGSMVVQLPGSSSLVGLRLQGQTAKVSPKLEAGKVIMRVTITASADVADLTTNQPPFDARAHHDLEYKLEELMSQAIKNEINQALARAQTDFKADIFGFGALIHSFLPDEWAKLRDNWDDDAFTRLEVRLNVQTKVTDSGCSVSGIVPK